MEAACFYSKHFEEFTNIVQLLDEESTTVISDIKNNIKNHKLKNELTYISTHFQKLVEVIGKLEEKCLPLSESLTLINNLKCHLQNVPGNIGRKVSNKFLEILSKNEGYTVLSKINNILSGSLNEQVNLSPEIISKFKNAPITSCDVERSFSDYKNVLSDRRQNFKVKNLEKYIVTYFNNRNN